MGPLGVSKPLGLASTLPAKGERHCGALFAEGARRAPALFGHATANDGDHFADFGRQPRPHPDFREPTSHDRLHFHRDFIGLDLEQVVAFLDLVADRLEPGENLALCNCLAELGHDDG